MLTLLKGRPESLKGRQEREKRVYAFLDSLEIAYERIDHDATMTMEACEEIDRALHATICKNLFLCNRQKTAFYLLMMPGDKPFKTKELSVQIQSSRLSFATPEDMLRLLDVTPGSVSVMGLLQDTLGEVQLLIDEDVLKEEYFGCHPCVNTSSLRIRTEDLLTRILPNLQHNYQTVVL